MPNQLHNPTCFADHMGLWAIESSWMSQAMSALRSGRLQMRDPERMRMACCATILGADIIETPAGGSYSRYDNGIAVIRLDGPLQKGWSKYGGTSTVAARQAIRSALADKKVGGILLGIDSPGGHSAGTQELGDDIARAAAIKPTWAHADDLIASAALWAGASASRLTINRTGEAGSIGTFMLVYDTSKQAQADGVEALLFTTGKFKGAGAPGAEITDEQRQYFQDRVDSVNGHFLRQIETQRGMTREQVLRSADGRVFEARDALARGLVDAVQSMDDTFQELSAVVERERDRNAARSKATTARARLSLLD